jgi:hypothetical protein
MKFLPNVKYVAVAKATFFDYEHGVHSMGCGHNFITSHRYELEITCEPYIFNDGELYLDLDIRVLDGSLDEYNRPNGVWFSDMESFNKYFKIEEIEME